MNCRKRQAFPPPIRRKIPLSQFPMPRTSHTISNFAILMDPIDIAEFVREVAVGVFAVFLLAAFGVTITPIEMSNNTAGHCFDISYEVLSIVASLLVSFSTMSFLCASSIKVVYKRPSDSNAEANARIAWRLVYILIPLAILTFILVFIFCVMVIQFRLGKIGCWSNVTLVLISGTCMIAIIALFIFTAICYRYGRDSDVFSTLPKSFADTG